MQLEMDSLTLLAFLALLHMLMRALLPGSVSAPGQVCSPPSRGHRDSKEQELHLGICHPEPPIVSHLGLLHWFLPLQRVYKSEPRIQAVSWLCLARDGGHVQGCVATLVHHKAWRLLSEAHFASPFQVASHSYTRSLLLSSPRTHRKMLHAAGAWDSLPEVSA